MSKKRTHEEYVAELAIKNPNLQVVEEYVDANTLILHRCLIHDICWKTTPSRALQGVGCEKCKKEKFRMTRCRSHEQYVQEVAKVNPDIIVVGQYVDARTPIEHYCKRHHIFWTTYPDNVLRGIGCRACGNEKIREQKIKSHDQYVKELHDINPNIEVIETYQGANIAILHRCKIDGFIWKVTPANTLFGKGCPQCKESHGEKQIKRWLTEHDISFIFQKKFDHCRNKRPLPFDFYLPEYNACIEYDGEQHFKSIDFFGGDEKFEYTQQNDEIKNQYCKDNNIRLLRIPYFKNVDEELNNFLFV